MPLHLHLLVSVAMLVSTAEKAAIDKWIKINGLDRYGSRKDTMYAGGSPAFDERTGERKDRYEYIAEKFADKPWRELEERTDL